MLDPIDVRYFKEALGSRIKKVSPSDVAAICPICNDRKARLHLYEKSGPAFVNCFNGGCEMNSQKIPYNFFKIYFPEIFENYKKESFYNNISNLRDSFADQNDLSKISWELDDIDDTPEEVPAPVKFLDLRPYFVDILDSEEAQEYIRSRVVDYDEKKYGKWFFCKTDLKIDDITYKTSNSIVLPLYYDKSKPETMYGFYSRNIYEKRFATFNQAVNLGYKIFNWFGINKEEPCYIFEGIFDMISSGKKNSIALMGAKIPEERLQELSKPVFCLDNDKAGIKNSVGYVEAGHKAFLWPSEIYDKDINSMKQKGTWEENIIDDNIVQGLSGAVKLKLKL